MSVTKILRKLEGSRRPAEVFATFVKLAACAVSCGRREAEYLEEIKRWPAEAAPIFAEAFAALVVEMEGEPYRDCLGATYMELLSSSAAQWGGEFHTPAEVCEMMARVTVDANPPPAEGLIRVCEPACGAGAQILAFAHALGTRDLHRVRVLATDLSVTACHMCYVNTTLWGIPTVIVHGNTLSGQTFAVWPNWPMLLHAPFSWRTCFNATEDPVAEARVQVTSEAIAELRAQTEEAPSNDEADALTMLAAAVASTPTKTSPSPVRIVTVQTTNPGLILNLRTRKREEHPAQLALF